MQTEPSKEEKTPEQDNQANPAHGGQKKPTLKPLKPVFQAAPAKKLNALDNFLKNLLKNLKNQNSNEAGLSPDSPEIRQFRKYAAPFLDTFKVLFNKESKVHFADEQVASANKAFNRLVDNHLKDIGLKPTGINRVGEALNDKGALKDTLHNVFESDDFKDALKLVSLSPTPSLEDEIDASEAEETPKEFKDEIKDEILTEEVIEDNEKENSEEKLALDNQIEKISEELSKKANGIAPGPLKDLSELPTPTPDG